MSIPALAPESPRNSLERDQVMRRAVIDIETVSGTRCEDAEETKRFALNPLRGRVVCIGMIFIEEFAAFKRVALIDQDERHLLTTFWQKLKEERCFRFIA